MSHIRINPSNPAPQNIIDTIVSLRVSYLDLNGIRQEGDIEIHKDAQEDVRAFFETSIACNFPIEKVVCSSDQPFEWDDDSLMSANATSGFNYRHIKGTSTPSLHGLGWAFDVNCRFNPYVRYLDDDTTEIDPVGATYDIHKEGTLSANHPLVTLMKQRGWTWGGDWTADSGRTDYQHFEKIEK
jgi:hypothetical protein